ncbi:mitochondrial biogenesis AIM24-domain-containing protein [Piptocephalis cylindrospora]|uniref:Altered inheritance of mitochondria protein 24, mitochondrial n=1 Tax=Piptocephalis cylindrospora TaxID=1907219 RepID=A0A4P9Y4C4_9FUNG|nr:mitochondrial biogenesis AIM24-domain-containing protein [Piptocephalis cylindrospora]|eukprot:RKP13594.1 mitochondrial biogenesis AIM24-domain-containing protein [Piptocephalis cylindrospora]
MLPIARSLKTTRTTTANLGGFYPLLLKPYVSLAYNRPEVTSPLPSSIGPGQVESTDQDEDGLVKEVEEPVDPKVGRTHVRPDISLEVLNAGLGSMILAQFPQGTSLRVQPGALVAHSSTTQRARIPFGPISTAVIARLIGDPFLLDEPAVQGDALIAPARMGDVALLSLGRDITASASALYARRGTILARGDGVAIRATTMTGNQTGLGVGYLLRGTGPVVLSADGGIFRLTLNPGEVYHVDAKRLVAWDSMLRPRANKEESKDQVSPLKEPPSWDSLVSHLSSKSSYPTKALSYTRAGWTWIMAHGRSYWAWWRQHSLLKHRPLCRFEGPGDIYLSSRLPSHPSLMQRYVFGWFGGGGTEATLRQSPPASPTSPPHLRGETRS